MQLSWYRRRLQQMSLGEVLHRVRRAARAAVDRLSHRRPRVLPHGDRIRGTELARPTWLVDLRRREAVAATVRDKLGWTDAPARSLANHMFSFFALENRFAGPTIRWNYDYAADRTAATGYAPWIDYRDEQECGNIKYVWEHNRHHHLVELAKASYLTGDRSFEDEMVQQIDGWIEECPFLYGVNWSSALEAAIRLINWSFCIQFVEAWSEDFEDRHPGFRRRWIASAREHLNFVAGQLSRFSSANNHLIGEAAGLFFGALSMRFPESDELARRAQQILEEEMDRQTWPDGVNKEQATGYQLFVFDFFLLAGLLGRQNGRPFRAQYWERLERMADYVGALTMETKRLPQIGDDDEGYVVRLTYAPDRNRVRSMLASAGLVFGRPDLLRQSGGIDEVAFWLTGRTEVPAGAHGHSGALPTRFPEGGYHMLKTARSRLIFDCGPLGYLSLAAHGHADALSLIVTLKGQELLVDPGTYAYHTKRRWRDYFRGTAAHNTLRIDGRDQSEIGGPFLWTRHANCTLLRSTDREVAGEHDGYRQLPDPVIHRREVALLEGEEGYEVIDSLRAAGTHDVELFFHCAPGWAVRVHETHVDLTLGRLRSRLVLDSSITEVTVYEGSEEPLSGWYSPRFDVLQPAPTIRCSLATSGDHVLRTRILFPTDQESL